MLQDINKYQTFTKAKKEKIRLELAANLPRRDYVVVTNGSYAREEASDESDLDYFLICSSTKGKNQAKRDLQRVQAILQKHVRKAYAAGGVFGKIEEIDDMSTNIGGMKDTNQKITLRVLFLLEGDWLYNKRLFTQYRDRIVKKYIKSKISDHQFCRFLLNDIIRYYRTICVDFEHKTVEAGKEWGTRNIKLVFSRKLLYFSGILVTAETWQHTYQSKMRIAKSLLSLTPIERVQRICGDKAKPALELYGEFLRKMGDPAVRRMTDNVSGYRAKQPEEFRLLKNEGHHFSWLLSKLLKETYDTAHPIHNGLVV